MDRIISRSQSTVNNWIAVKAEDCNVIGLKERGTAVFTGIATLNCNFLPLYCFRDCPEVI